MFNQRRKLSTCAANAGRDVIKLVALQIAAIASDPATKRALLDAIAVRRERVFAGRTGIGGEFTRIEHYCFRHRP
jgi:hypothetical protein